MAKHKTDKKFLNVVMNDGDPARIYCYGIIGIEVLASDFITALIACEKSSNDIEVHINSEGGDIFEGLAIFNAIRASKANLSGYIDGIAASMGSVIACAFKNLYMSRFARIVIHRPSGQANGDADDFEHGAKQLISLQTDLATIISERTKLPPDQVQSKWFQKGINSWFTGEEAKQAGFVNDTYDGIPIIIPDNIKDSNQAYKIYQNKFINQIQSTMKDNTRFINLLNGAGHSVPADADDEKLLSVFTDLIGKNTNLTAENKQLKLDAENMRKKESDAQALRIKGMLDAAILEKKITESERPTWQALLEKDFDNASTILNAKAAYKPITGQIKKEKDANTDRANWTFSDWTKKDHVGLQNMKETDVAAFKDLYKAEYHVDWKE